MALFHFSADGRSKGKRVERLRQRDSHSIPRKAAREPPHSIFLPLLPTDLRDRLAKVGFNLGKALRKTPAQMLTMMHAQFHRRLVL